MGLNGSKQAFVAEIEKQHGARLRRFLASRLRRGAVDIADLVQEVFLRLLRVDHHETIRSSEPYLFTIAFHVLHQHKLRQSAIPEAVEISALIDEMEAPGRDPASQAEVRGSGIAGGFPGREDDCNPRRHRKGSWCRLVCFAAHLCLTHPG